MKFDHLLLIGFGGPAQPEEVEPFLREVARGAANLPESRLKEVLHHYEIIGGASPYNESAFRLFRNLEESLPRNEIQLPLFIGMRNWHPFLKETLSEIKKRGLKKGLGVVLAPQRSEASFERYVQSVEEAKKVVSACEIEYDYLKPWYDHWLFIEAQVDQIRKVDDPSAHLLFSAHSIPLEVAQKSRYREEVKMASELVAKKLNHRQWSVAYQSRSGNPRDPWLGPDVCSAIRELKAGGESTVILVPIGFLCDNAEILYDLDVEAKAEAEKIGIRYLRASTVMDHPTLAEMFSELIRGALFSSGDKKRNISRQGKLG